MWNKAGLDVYAKSHTCITSSLGLFYSGVARGPGRQRPENISRPTFVA